MAFTAFISQAGGGSREHNERDFNDKHKEPDYLLPAEYRLENIHITEDLTPAMVHQEYLETADFGRKHDRLHHKAEPVREAVIVCNQSTSEADVRTLMDELETGLDIRSMYAHIHKDEGHIDENGKVEHNFHIHYGYTNLVIEKDNQGQRRGTLTHMNQARMSKAQDICARVLGMERAKTYKDRKKDGEIDKNPVHIDAKQFRAAKRAEAKAVAEVQAKADEQVQAVKTELGTLKTEYQKLGELNKSIRAEMTATGEAHKEDYQVWKKTLNDAKKTYEEKEAAGRTLVGDLQRRLKETETARDAAIVQRDEEKKRAANTVSKLTGANTQVQNAQRRAAAAEERAGKAVTRAETAERTLTGANTQVQNAQRQAAAAEERAGKAVTRAETAERTLTGANTQVQNAQRRAAAAEERAGKAVTRAETAERTLTGTNTQVQNAQRRAAAAEERAGKAVTRAETAERTLTGTNIQVQNAQRRAAAAEERAGKAVTRAETAERTLTGTNTQVQNAQRRTAAAEERAGKAVTRAETAESELKRRDQADQGAAWTLPAPERMEFATTYRKRIKQPLTQELARRQERTQKAADEKARKHMSLEIQGTVKRAEKAEGRARTAESALARLKERCKVFLDLLDGLPEKMHDVFKHLVEVAAKAAREHFTEREQSQTPATKQSTAQTKTPDPWEYGK